MSSADRIATPASPEKRDKVRKRSASIGEEGGSGRATPPKKARTGEVVEAVAGPISAARSAAVSTSSTPSTRHELASLESISTAATSAAPSPLRLDLDKLPPRFTGSYSGSLSRRSSMNSLSRAHSPLVRTPSSTFGSLGDDGPWPNDILRSRIIRRSASSASLRSMSPSTPSAPVEPVYATESARNFMRNPKFVVDYTQPSIIRPQPPAPAAPADTGATGGEATTDAAATVPAAPATVAPPPPVPGFIPPPPAPERHPRDLPPTVRAHTLACSGSGILFFTRANRLHFKNLTANEEVGQICKIQEIHGVFTAIACGGSGETGGYVVAVGTSKGVVAIYDVQTKKRVLSWTLKPGVASLAWNGKILTIGAASGTIVHYDTRISPVEKMKEQAVTVTRHQAPITRMEWNAEGDMLASADKKGNVYCWKTGEKVPLDVGEFVLRRKKIKHCAAISAVSWCPWQPKNLVTADIKGVVQFWTIDPKNKDTNAMTPARLDTGSSITGLHWSSQCKEFMTTHGYKVPEHLAPPPPPPPPSSSGPLFPYPPPPGPNVENTLAVWQFPSLRFVTNMRMNTTDVPIGNSVVFAKGMKVVFGVPEQGKIHACDVWGKKKPDVKIRRQSSLDYVGCIR